VIVDTLREFGPYVPCEQLLTTLQTRDPAVKASNLASMLTGMRQDGLIERTRYAHYQVASPRSRLTFIAPAAVGD
jgi:DNA-binding HxlR family transcriptional regulator